MATKGLTRKDELHYVIYRYLNAQEGFDHNRAYRAATEISRQMVALGFTVRRAVRGEASVIHVHDKSGGGTVAFRVGQAEARALIDALSKVTLMPPSDGGHSDE